jgi:hypothetical protein
MFTSAELTPWGIEKIQTIFPDALTALERMDIDLVGAPATGKGRSDSPSEMTTFRMVHNCMYPAGVS